MGTLMLDRILGRLAEQFDVHLNQIAIGAARGGAADVFGAGGDGGAQPAVKSSRNRCNRLRSAPANKFKRC